MAANRNYDVFLSYHRDDAEIAERLRRALSAEGLEVFFDDHEVEDFESITARLSVGLARSKALLALYSATYPARRACQFELTTAFLAAQRAGDPRARVLVVNPEEGVEHIAPAEVRDALFRRLREGDELELVAGAAASVARHVRRLEGLLGDIQPLAPVSWYGRRPVSSPWFVGRIAAMWELHSKLHAGELRPMTGASGPGVAQLRGLGGVGKTLLAEEYGLRFAPAYPGGVFWLSALGESPDADGGFSAAERGAERERQVRTVAVAVGVAVDGLSDPADVEAALAQELERRGEPYLWVVDDLPAGLDANEVRAWFAPHRLGKTLLTTRSRQYGALGAVVEPGVLSSQEAYELLALHRSPSGEGQARHAEQLAEELGCHALALQIAGAAVANAAGPTPFADFRMALARPGEDELEFAAELADVQPTGHEPSIAKTLLTSVAGLGEEASDLLRLASMVASVPIPGTFVDHVFAAADDLDELSARRRGTRARQEAGRSSLSDQSLGGEAVSVHPVVAALSALATTGGGSAMSSCAVLRSMCSASNWRRSAARALPVSTSSSRTPVS